MAAQGNHRHQRVGVGLALAVLLATVANGRAQMIEMRSNDAIEGGMVLLQDIVRAPYALPEDWRTREIVKAPAPGEPLDISLTAVASALSRYPDMSRVVLRGESRIVLRRLGSMMAMDKIQEAIRAYAEGLPQWSGTPLHVECEQTTVEIASSAQDPEILVKSVTAEDRPNRYRFKIEVSGGETPVRELSVSARVEAKQKVWATTRAVERGHVLTAEDLEILWMPPDAAQPYLPGEDPAIGMEANRGIRAQQPLAPHFLIAPVYARRGDTVNVMAMRGGLQVALRATAMANGRRGERIMCMNEVSKRRFLVRLTDVREATIDF